MISVEHPSSSPRPPVHPPEPLHCRPLLPLPGFEVWPGPFLHPPPLPLPARTVLMVLTLMSLTLETSEHHVEGVSETICSSPGSVRGDIWRQRRWDPTAQASCTPEAGPRLPLEESGGRRSGETAGETETRPCWESPGI